MIDKLVKSTSMRHYIERTNVIYDSMEVRRFNKKEKINKFPFTEQWKACDCVSSSGYLE